MLKPKILVLLDNPYLPDNRVENQIHALLEKDYSIDLYCVESKDLPLEEEIGKLKIHRGISNRIDRPLSIEYRRFSKEFAEQMASADHSIIHCHDFRMLHLAMQIRRKKPEVKIIYDAHEYLIGYPYYMRSKSLVTRMKGFLIWLLYVMREAHEIQDCDAIITVSATLRKKLAKRSGRPAYLLRNIPPNWDICKENCTYWQEQFGLDNNVKTFIHTGNAYFSLQRRQILLNAFKDRKDLALIFLGSNPSLEEIKANVSDQGINNVYFHEQVPRKYVTYYCSQADFGLVYTWNKKWASYWNALPNKLIDVSLSGIPVLSTAQPELKGFIDENRNGETFDGDSEKELIEAIDRIIDHEDELKKHASNVSQNVNWDLEKQVLYQVYKSLKSE